MLPFMREQGLGDLSPQKPGLASSQSSSPASGDGQGQEYLTVASRGRNARRSTIMVAILIGIGLLGLWFMIKKSKPQSACAASNETEETKIEGAIARLTGVSSEMLNRMDQIVNKFYEFSNVLQVGVSELAKNPFELEMFLSQLKAETDAQGQELEVDVEMIRRQQLRQQAKNMHLVSIMHSDQGGCCMIDDRILSKGESINGFTISEIGDRFVKLRFGCQNDPTSPDEQSQDLEIILKLSEE
jgi:hypothetical protein